MSLYKPNNFSYRDTLPADNPEKVIKGQTFDVEFDAIARAFNSVEHILDPDNDGLDAIVEEAPIDGEIYARQDGHWVKIDGVSLSWNDITDKPPQIVALGDYNIITGGSF